MDGLNPEEVLKFLNLVNNLKHLPRRGWEFNQLKNIEPIAAHMYSMGIMTFLLGNNSELDRFKCLQLTLVHDLAECIVGDITPHDNIPEETKHAMEDKAMKEITAHIGEIGSFIYALYKEYEAKETPEAKFVKDLDRLDLLCTAVHYEQRDKCRLQEYFDSLKGKFENPFVCKLVDELEKQRSNKEFASKDQIHLCNEVEKH